MVAQAQISKFDDIYFLNKTYRVTVPRGTTLNEILAPTFWALVAMRLRRFDRIEVISEDGSFDCDLRVIESGRTDAVVRLIRAPIEAPVAEAPAAAEGKTYPCTHWAGARHKWRVLAADKTVFAENISTEEEANDRLAEYRARFAQAA